MKEAALYEDVVEKLLQEVPERTREVLERRYGLNSESETLERIGNDIGVTRERVRQIEASGLTRLRKGDVSHFVKPIVEELHGHLQDHGAVRAEHHLFDDFDPHARPQVLLFLLDLGEPFSRHRENDHRHTAWTIDREELKRAEGFVKALAARLREIKEALEEEAFWEMVEEEARQRRLELHERAQRSWVGVSRHIDKGPLGTWGLRAWPNIAPHNVGDWAFIALRDTGKPLHFSDIVEHINKKREDRNAHLQTVHNELIKDDRFVLIGRGIYALREWGYRPGTVRDVIAELLEGAKEPMPREEIVDKVLEVRMVQPNTILLSLQDKDLFARTQDGRYTVNRKSRAKTRR